MMIFIMQLFGRDQLLMSFSLLQIAYIDFETHPAPYSIVTGILSRGSPACVWSELLASFSCRCSGSLEP